MRDGLRATIRWLTLSGKSSSDATEMAVNCSTCIVNAVFEPHRRDAHRRDLLRTCDQ